MEQLELLPLDHNEPAELCAAIRARRGGSLMKLDRMLLHSPVVAEGWNIYMGNLRTKLTLNPQLRELAMCVVAVINKADYEYEAHAPIYVAEGASQAQADALLKAGSDAFDASLFNDLERDAVALVVAMTRDIVVPENLKSRLLSQIGSGHLVELIAVTAAYNMVSRFLVATGIHSEKKKL
ncbi:MAG: carboxymuconolactone decarboxylase family protein [Alphaproteobacteria bacterium]